MSKASISNTILHDSYNHLRNFAYQCRPSVVRRKTLMAWSRYSGRPVADSLPGLDFKMWLTPHDYYAHSYQRQHVVEPGVLKFLKRHITPGMTIFDVGANVGYITLFCAGLIGDQGRVVAFEPGQRAYQRLVTNIKLNNFKNILPVQEALSDIDGHETYCQAVECSRDVYNSLLTVDTPWTSTDDFQMIQIPVRRLDTIVLESGWSIPEIIKIDVEGAERKVILGMAEVLRQGSTRILIMEISDLYFAKFGHSTRELVKDLEQLGFLCREIAQSGDLSALDLDDASGKARMMAAIRG